MDRIRIFPISPIVLLAILTAVTIARFAQVLTVIMPTSPSTIKFSTVLALALCPWLTLVAQTPAPTGRLISRQAVAVDSTRHKAYVVDTDANTIWGIDTATQASTKISVGKSPIAIGIDVQGGKVYVLNTEGASVSVVDEATNAVVKTVNVGERPYSLAVDPQSSKVIVSNVYSDLLTIIDGATLTTTTRKLGSFDAMTVNAKTDTFYLLSYEGGGLVALNGTEGASRKFSTGQMHIWGLATDDSKNILYVTHIGNANLAAIDETTHKQTNIPTGAFPSAVAVNSSTHTLYVTNYGDDSVTVIDGAKLTATAKVPVGQKPQAVVVDGNTGLVYVANTHGDSVTVINGRNHAVVATLPAGKNPYGLALDPQTGSLYVSNEANPAYTYLDVKKLR